MYNAYWVEGPCGLHFWGVVRVCDASLDASSLLALLYSVYSCEAPIYANCMMCIAMGRPCMLLSRGVVAVRDAPPGGSRCRIVLITRHVLQYARYLNLRLSNASDVDQSGLTR